MKARYGMTSQGRSAMIKEINRQIAEQEEMRKFFETDDTFPAEYKLKELGVDMEKLRNED